VWSVAECSLISLMTIEGSASAWVVAPRVDPGRLENVWELFKATPTSVCVRPHGVRSQSTISMTSECASGLPSLGELVLSLVIWAVACMLRTGYACLPLCVALLALFSAVVTALIWNAAALLVQGDARTMVTRSLTWAV
jgi:hypothetical protein